MDKDLQEINANASRVTAAGVRRLVAALQRHRSALRVLNRHIDTETIDCIEVASNERLFLALERIGQLAVWADNEMPDIDLGEVT